MMLLALLAVSPGPALASETGGARQLLVDERGHSFERLPAGIPAGGSPGQDRPSLDGDAVIVYAANGVPSKGDLASATGLKIHPVFDAGESGSPGNNGKGDLMTPAIRSEELGVAAVILLSLWLVITAFVIVVHSEQKTDRRRGLATLQGVLRRRSQPAGKAVPPGGWALEARPNALLDHGWRMKRMTANSNTRKAEVHAA